MAKAKSTTGTTRMTYSNGVTVTVSADKAGRLVSSGFTEVKAAKPAAKTAAAEPSES